MTIYMIIRYEANEGQKVHSLWFDRKLANSKTKELNNKEKDITVEFRVEAVDTEDDLPGPRIE